MRALSLATSGIAAASAALEVTAQNVANLSTDAAPLRATHEELAAGGVRVTISPEARAFADLASRGVDIVREVPAGIAAVAAYRANLKSLEAADEVLQALLEVSWGRVSAR